MEVASRRVRWHSYRMATSGLREKAGTRTGIGFYLRYAGNLAVATVRGFLLHHGFTTSAALAFYFLLSLLPFLISLASALALFPINHLPMRMIQLVAHFVPTNTMPMVESMLKATMQPNQGLLSAGFIVAVIAASNGFAVMSYLLDVVYEVDHPQKFWRNRIYAIGTTFVVGGMTIVALSAMLLGPHFGRELERVFGVSHTFSIVWPTLRWVLAVTFGMAAVEVLYYMCVSREHSLRQQLPGSVFAVAIWIVSTVAMGIYFRQFAYINAMYGTLASFIILAIWLQITAIAMLLGAELNMQVERAGERPTLEASREVSPKSVAQKPTHSIAP